MNNACWQLINRDDMRRLTRRRNAPGIVRLALHGGLIGFAALAVGGSQSWVAYLLSAMLLGIPLAFLFAPCHETTHRTAFATRPLNTAVGMLCGFIIFLPYQYFRAFHMAHHRHTQDPVRDPELAAPRPRTWPEYLYYLSGIGYWKEQGLMLYRCAFTDHRPAFISTAKSASIQNEARVHTALYAALLIASAATGSVWIFQWWIVPLLLGQPFLRAFLLAEHTLCPEVPAMTRNTRTTISNPIVRLLCWNMNYHAEHHTSPAVPFFNLHLMHRHIAREIEHLASGYIRVHRTIQASLTRG